LFSTTHPSSFHVDRIVLREEGGTGTHEVGLVVSDSLSDNLKQINIQLGNTSRTIRFDGVGTPVTFT
jgi:hypothetical protein